jgi:histone deacetylase 1/2
VSNSRAAHPFDLIHCDLWTSPVVSLSGYKYYLVILDDCTHYTWTFPLRLKSDTFSVLSNFFSYVRTQFDSTIKAVQCDNGREFDHSSARTFFLTHGVVFRMSCPYTSQQNGRAERTLRTVNNIVRSLLFQASLPLAYWADSLHTATYLLNRHPTKTLDGRTPFFALYGTQPSYTHLRVFGCACYPNLSSTAKHKLSPRSSLYVFLGYSSDHKGYRCLDLHSNRIIVSRHVVFNETLFPFSEMSTTPQDPDTLAFLDDADDSSSPTWPRVVDAGTRLPGGTDAAPGSPGAFSPGAGAGSPAGEVPDTLSGASTVASPGAGAPTAPAGAAAPADSMSQAVASGADRTTGRTIVTAPQAIVPVTNVHSMHTRGKDGFRQPVDRLNLHTTAATTSPVPSSVCAALSDPAWRLAMQAEFDALQANDTWTLVPRPPGVNLVTGKWVFRHKLKSDGSLDRYKARWVLRGFTQRPGIDYDEAFSPVIKPATIRMVLTLALSRSWPIHQLDVKNAFLNGTLTETVYCVQPTGFVDSSQPNYVCRLNKSLYGLKQAPRAWHSRFASHITSLGFVEAKSDTSLFIYCQGADMAFLLLYVDDIVLTASSSSFLHRIIVALRQEFSMTDMGPLHHFLGVSVQRRGDRLFLSQRQYVLDILERAGMSNCKPSSTPVDTHSKLSFDGVSVVDPSHYRSLARALQYLTFTRPDIAYAVQQICLYMHDPREPHLSALKRVLRYLQGTLDLGLHLHRTSPADLTVYTDADWAGCPDTRKSTSGYAVFLGDNLISWSSKRQPTVSRSSAEAEYRAVANGVAEASWLRQLLQELCCPLRRATVVYCDNISAVYLSTNSVLHQRTKHVEIDLHFVRERVALGEVRVLHVPTSSQYADIFTKGLPTSVFTEFRSSLNVRGAPSSDCGGVLECNMACGPTWLATVPIYVNTNHS